MSELTRNTRRSIRLKGYDYSQSGLYYVTICSENRVCIFGEIDEEVMVLNALGRIAVEIWEELPARFPNLVLDAFVVMPNHMHMIVSIVELDDWILENAQKKMNEINRNPTLGSIIGAYKSLLTAQYIRNVKSSGWTPFQTRLLQRNFYEQIIRDDGSLDIIRAYIQSNPSLWTSDENNVATNRI